MRIAPILKAGLICILLGNTLTANAQSGIRFEENKGQWPSPVFYKANIPSGQVFLEQDAMLFSYYSTADLERIHEEAHEGNSIEEIREAESQKVRCFAYRVRFVGKSNDALVTGENQKTEYSNYFLGNQSEHWAGNVRNYGLAQYKSIYAGINLLLYGHEINPKYDFAIAPHADPSKIQLLYEGVNQIRLENGKLLIDLGFMTITEDAPFAYQIIQGVKKVVNCNFVLKNNLVSFEFPEGYDKSYELIIDPVIVASTYSGSTATTYGHSATFDDLGNIYSAGRCFGPGYPATVGAYDLSFGGSVDISISKYDPNGTSLLYATYIGGSLTEYAHSMFAHNNELYIYGSAASSDYPTTAGAFDGTQNGGYDIIVTHLNNTGSALLGSTFVGGTLDDGSNIVYTNYGDTYRGEIIVDGSGNALISTFTSSTNFPATVGAYDASANGGQDGCVLKLSPNMSTLIWATYLGGTTNDAAFGIRENSLGNVYVCGATSSSNFPSTVGTYQPSYLGGLDGFIVELSNSGTGLLASTFFGTGTTSLDEAFFIDIDLDDDVYIYGEADGGAPVTVGAFSVPGSVMYVSKFNPSLTSLLVSTVIGNGTSSRLAPSAFMVDVCKNIYLAGFGGTAGFPVTNDAFYSTPSVGTCYLAALAPNASSLLFGTFYGAYHVDGGTSRFDPNGIVYHAVCQGGAGFPTQANAWNTGISPPSWDVCVFKINFEQTGVMAAALPSPASSGCAPFTVNFNNGSTGIDYIWDYGDGSPLDTTTTPSHLYTSSGTFTVTLIAIDSASCNISDTAYLTINVLNPITALLGPDTAFCPPNTILLDAGIIGASYLWNTGDTTQTINANSTGIYSVTVSIGSSCNATDSIVLSSFTFAGLGPDIEICPGSSVLLSGNTAGVNYVWSTGETTNAISVSQAGSYWVNMSYGNCLSSDTIVLDYSAGGTVLPPNVFSPNNDGVNDLFDIGNPVFDLFEIRIYDRWGMEVFYTNNPAFKWDGKYNNKECPDGVFYWIVHYMDCTGTEAEKTGFVHVVR
jgi:gliding motility-associated-like protein